MSGKLQALIVDDERLAREEMRTLLAAHPEVAIIGEASTLAQATGLIAETRPDIIFLDIQLGRQSGFELLPQPGDAHDDDGDPMRDAHIIFVTGYAEHAVRAFEVNALDYLLKPVRPERLAEAIQRARAGAPAPERQHRRSQPLQPQDVVILRQGRGFRFVPVNEIVFISAEDDYSCVHTADGQESLVDTPLRDWERRLPGRAFIRIHRSTIVHVRYIASMEASSGAGYQLRLRNRDTTLAVSRRYAARFKESFGL